MISAQVRAQVRVRAQNACEYCHLHQDDSPLAALHVAHITPKIHGGNDDIDNLALACIDCKLHKGTGKLVTHITRGLFVLLTFSRLTLRTTVCSVFSIHNKDAKVIRWSAEMI